MALPRTTKKAMRTGKNALIVLRTSGADKRNGSKQKNGKEVQYDWCETYCETEGYTIAPIVFYDDGVSGTYKLEERPALSAAFTYAITHNIDVIVMMDAERLGRETEAYTNIRSAFIAEGIRLETAKERLNHCDPDSKFISNIYAAVAEQDKDNTVKKLYMGRKVKSKKDGMGSGFLPYGYTYENGVIVVDNDAADTVRMVLKLRETLSYGKACKALNDAGILTPTGSDTWGNGNIQSIERNRALYTTGVRTWGNVSASETWPIIVKDGE